MSGQDSCITVTFGTVRWIAVALVGAAAGGGLVWSLQPGRFDNERVATLPAPVMLHVQDSTEEAKSSRSESVVEATPQRAVAVESAPVASAADASEPFVLGLEFIGPPAPEPERPIAVVPESSPATETPALPAPTTIKRVMPAETTAPTPTALRAPTLVSPKRININTAGKAELELLPSVGPALAQRIIDHRAKNGPFVKIEDLDKVKGIGPKTLEKLRPLVSVQDNPPPRRAAGT